MVTSPFAHQIRLAVAAVLSISAVSSWISANAGPKETVNDIASGVNDRLYYRAPAAIWEETLPLGNGRLGMMPDGGVFRERIVLNEISMWSGGESDYQNPDAAKSLPEIRRLLSEGKNAEAQEIMYEHFVTKKETYDPRYGCYQVLADLDIDFRYGTAASRSSASCEFTDYVRDLSLADAVSHTRFTLDGTCYRREYFTSRDKDVFMVKLSADGPGTLDFTARLSREKDAVLRLSMDRQSSKACSIAAILTRMA